MRGNRGPGSRSRERPGIHCGRTGCHRRRASSAASAPGARTSADQFPKSAGTTGMTGVPGPPAQTHFPSSQEGADSGPACSPHGPRMRLPSGGSGAPRRADWAPWLRVRLRRRWGLATSASPPPDAPRGLPARRDHVHQHRLQWAL